MNKATSTAQSTLKSFSYRTPDSKSFISAKNTASMTLDDGTGQVSMAALRAYRLARLQSELKAGGYDAALLNDPINVRYATGTRNMTVWLLHNHGRYCLVPAEGKVVLFEYSNNNCRDLAKGIEVIGDIRRAKGWSYFFAGEHTAEVCKDWADEIADVVKSFAGNGRRIAVDRLEPMGSHALEARGFTLGDGQEVCERARAIKSAEEIACMSIAMAATDVGMARMREALTPGITENQLWAELHYANIAAGGEWIESRMLNSGGRTNPWFQESSDRVIRPGDLISFDTDLIGPYGYCADVSRTFFCGPGRPSDEQKMLYGLAMEQIHHNLELIKPGLSFRELRSKAWKVPGRYDEQKYSSIAHGVGLCDEWPAIAYDGIDRMNQEGTLDPGMVVCIESYMGEKNGAEGVKLEQQILVTDKGIELLSTFPFEEALCS
jgi:Xaa-Pro aminopeptidase